MISFDCIHVYALNRYEIDDLVTERKFLVNLNLQICFESNKPCDVDIPVFTNTKLPKKPCDWTTDFIDDGKFLLEFCLVFYLNLSLFTGTKARDILL